MIEREHTGRTYRHVLLRRTCREGEKVNHETLGNLSDLPEEWIDTLRRGPRNETLVIQEGG